MGQMLNRSVKPDQCIGRTDLDRNRLCTGFKAVDLETDKERDPGVAGHFLDLTLSCRLINRTWAFIDGNHPDHSETRRCAARPDGPDHHAL